jgi:DNA polymerase-3 subunit alpha
MMGLARALDLPLLITLDAHMVSKETKFIQDILLQNGNPDGWRFSTTYFQMNTNEAWQSWCEMGLGDFANEFAEGVDNNTMLADMIEEDMQLEKKIRLPHITIPADIRAMAPEDRSEQYLQIALRQIKYHGRMKQTEVYYARLEEELRVICDNGVVNFLPYFLFLEDVCRDARANGDYVGPGRGSAAGSLLSYLLGITQLDPIERGLSFARFLSQGRINRGKFPDIDLDFGDPGAVVDRLKERFGDNVVRINTVGTMKVKGAIKDVARILLDTRRNPKAKDEVEEVCKSIGNIPQGISDTNKWLYGYTDADGNSHPGEADLNGMLSRFFVKYPEVERGVTGVLDIPRSIGRHASAFCVAEEGIRDIIPICRVKGQECTQFTMGPVEELGLLKMDFLGLNTLKDIGRCLEWIERLRGIKLDPYALNESNQQVWAAFGRGRNETVFQFNGKIGVELCRKVRPRSVDELAQITSAGRPGTLDALMPDGHTKVVDNWVKVKRGEADPSFVHDSIVPILESTGGACLFQEQISAMFQIACGYTEEQADEIREIVGKKKKDQMDRLIPEIRTRLAASGWNEVQAESFISLCNAAANYSFNKSHAVAYSYVAYVCQYLKTVYPLEWWTSVLQNSDADDLRENARFCADLVHKPDVNFSDLDFFVASLDAIQGSSEDGRIIYPLRMVRGVGTAAESIIKTREEGGPFLSLEDFYNRVNRTKVNVGIVANLIYAGAFDNIFGSVRITDRNHMLEAYGRLRGDLGDERYARKSKLELMNIQAKVLPLWAPDYVTYIREFTPISVSCPSLVNELPKSSAVIIGGIVRSVRRVTTKKGDPMCFLTLGNRNEIADVTVFPDLYSKEDGGVSHAELLQEGEVLFIDGKVNEYNGKRSMIADQIWYFTDKTPGEREEAPNPMDQIPEDQLAEPQ